MTFRPPIPVEVKCRVAIRQLGFAGSVDTILGLHRYRPGGEAKGFTALLPKLLGDLALKLGCEVKLLRLDHDPALVLREFNARTLIYTPDANDPDYMLYRVKEAHDFKTYKKGDGARRSDISEMVHQRRVKRRLEEHRAKMADKGKHKHKKRKPDRPKKKIQSRGFPKVHRPFPKRRLTRR